MSPEKRELQAKGTRDEGAAVGPARSRETEADTRKTVTAHERRHRIAERAYYKALERGFGGGEVERDWLEAEREIDEEILKA